MNILQMSLSASAIILFTMLLRKLALNHLPKRTFVVLWLLATVRMLVPWKLPFHYGASSILQRATMATTPKVNTPIQRVLTPAVTASSTTSIDIWHIIWIAGLIFCALMFFLPHRRWQRIFARSLPLTNVWIDDWIRRHPLHRSVRVRTSDEILTPLTFGLVRPVILLPFDMDRSDEERLDCVLMHELIHIRRLDGLWKLLLAVALCVHWFNPLAWLMYFLANQDIELACDEAVLHNCGAQMRREYAHALINLAAHQSGLPSPLFNDFSHQTIEERIQAIMKMRNLTKIAALAGVLLVAFTALAFATTVEEEKLLPEFEDLMFEGYADLSVEEYRRILYKLLEDPAELFESEAQLDNRRYADYLSYVLTPLTNANWETQNWTLEWSEGELNLDNGETAGSYYRLTCQILDPDRLTVGRLRDALRGIFQGIESLELTDTTQEALTAAANALSASWSDEEIATFQLETELTGDDTIDSDSLELLQELKPLGLEYETSFENLRIYYKGIEVQSVWDPVRQIIVSNSAGPRGIGGGRMLTVTYADGKPASLEFAKGKE